MPNQRECSRLGTNGSLLGSYLFGYEEVEIAIFVKKLKSPLSTVGMPSQLQNIASQLGNGREEDAHEFLRYAIDAMQSVCLKEAGVNAVDSFEIETTLIGLTFGGYLHSKVPITLKRGSSRKAKEVLFSITFFVPHCCF